MVAGGDAEAAVVVADALKEAHEPGPVARKRHRVNVLGEDEAVAFGEAIDRLRVVRLEGHFPEQVEFVGLADIFAREVDDAFPQVGLGGLEMAKVETGFRFVELVKRLGEQGRELGWLGRRSGEGAERRQRKNEREETERLHDDKNKKGRPG